ncbi:MAG: adenylate/guanylate cyclase domain-containing protein [Proteobacteria bacterium]|nr:adenylate/guanylate cyclase domain-containing protein [Pseudomonadota bacterium]MBU1449756.1 adenylate/guanylate cyclase domain-containing protein [Pseudomonadota bacterium]MBU2468993.1 adenylate/guanylate cyclase domain-containing protein [Pseudomonadota bacterium]MBU2517251.1 adenylate/guanylate cyclase domain-containing protein [Pseudomonadota bacterium]
MVQQDAPSKRRRRYPLSLNILTIFLLLMIAVAGSITWYNYRTSSDRAMMASRRLMHDIVGQFTGQLTEFFSKARSFVVLSAEHPGIKHPPVDEGHSLEGLFIKALASHPQFFGIYLGYDDGHFFQVVRLGQLAPKAREDIKAPPGAMYGVRSIIQNPGGPRIVTWRFLDEQKRQLSAWSLSAPAYDPRGRPWYKLAQEAGRVYGTNYYVFDSLREPGMTLAYRFAPAPKGGVLGVDVSARTLCEFTASHKVGDSGLTVVFDSQRRLVAYPQAKQIVKVARQDGKEVLGLATLDNLGNPLLGELSRLFDPQAKEQLLNFEVKGREYAAGVERIKDFQGQWNYVAVLTPLDELMGPIIQSNLRSLLISLLIMLASVPLVVIIARRISRPLGQVVAETKAMRNLQLEPTPAIDSHISEIHRLTQSVATMKTTLRTFSRYVPVDLVRQLVFSGKEQGLGGEKRVLTLMFSDVANFTDMAEHMDPEALMLKASAYFSGLCEEIQANQGTIDKFIGDAIMAFWNAPLADAEHAAHACRAALLCRRHSQQMDQAWQEAGQPIMHTRLGLHTGEVIVGNVGAAQRMDYTALGAAVNLASRLEGLNKVYGTQILASQAVRRAAGEGFVWRTVDQVEPKGTSEPTLIYELVGLLGDLPELAPDPAALEYCDRWEAAFALYRERDWPGAAQAFAALAGERPSDQAAQVLARRTAAFAADPPPPDWDGSAVYDSK